MLQVQLRQDTPVSLQATLACAAGELVAVVGPSGTGKSTLLKSVAGLLEGATGVVRVGTTTWLDSAAGIRVPAHRRRVGFVFQSYALFPHLSVLENVMAAAEGTRAEREAQALAALRAVRMAGMEARRPGQLSGGQQQRAGLARALARKPDVLLLDEPFSAVDQMTKELLYEELAELRATLAIPTILVTHSIPEAQVLADRIVVLHRGKTLQEGDPEYVYRHPAEADVARLLGHRNVFPAAVEFRHGRPLLRWQGLELELSGASKPGPVHFCIATDDVRLIDEDTQAVNALHARVLRTMSIGANTRVYAQLPNQEVVALTAPKHVLRRRRVEVGQEIRIAMPAEALHLMGV